ncbi:hypothetical protein K2X14_11485 [Acetobacter sp. TBRC 12305]|uniref:Uncharacterized protein n=1 Tax=Acetobacter garciniae TaxID=2817435 RepID=A0A939HP63_9PROT|nr:hypothetical protein [Acetobacter garciniae]MBO1325368.1 hypothetical protein [Acetobacter garciniae]MBX0345460.1 hypothetical protein [Acetobacter garciniae]
MTEEERIRLYRGAFSFDPVNRCDVFNTPAAYTAPFLAQSLVTTAELWGWLHPFATLPERVRLVQDMARKMGVEVRMAC